MAEIIDARVKQKTGTAADFAGYTLLEGEIALVRTSANGPVWNFKVGPGNFDSLDWSLQNPGAAQKADTSTVFPVGVPGLYIPTESGTYDGVSVDLEAGYVQLIWDGSTLVKAEFPIDLAGYATVDDLVDESEVYNATRQSPPPSGFHTFETAVESVPDSVRKTGLILTFRSSSNFWQRYQYILSSPAPETFENPDNWNNLSQTAQINAVRDVLNEWNATEKSPPGAGFHSFETAVQTVPSYMIKQGLVLSYQSGSQIWLTYRYVISNTNATQFSDIDNWTLIPNARDITVYDATISSPPPSGFHTFESAIASVPMNIRKGGLIITFRQSSNVRRVLQYILTATSGAGWENPDNWWDFNNNAFVTEVRSYNNVWNATVQDPVEGYHDFLSAVNSVPSFFRRTGVIVTFRASASLWRRFQYRLSSPSTPTWDNQENWIEIQPELIPIWHRNGMSNMLETIRDIDTGQFSIMFATDLHITHDPPYRYTGIEVLGRIMNTLHEQCEFSAVVMGGDYVEKDIATEDEARTYMQKLQEWTAATADKRIITRGNHEWEPLFDEARFYAYSKRGMYGHMAITDNPIDQKSDYGYIDYPNEKIRLVFLDLSFLTYDGSESDIQFDWMLEVLESTAEMDDWMIVVTGHISPYQRPSGDNGNYLVAMGHYFEKTAGILQSSRSSQSVDFTSSTSNDLISISGHTHNSGDFDDTFLSIETAAAQVHPDYLGTRNELAFDIYFIDRSERHIDVIRYGRGASRSFDY